MAYESIELIMQTLDAEAEQKVLGIITDKYLNFRNHELIKS